jgi:DNA repair protein RAD5
VEEQAVMRIHRIGQTKRVMIRRFIVKVHFFFVL